MTDYKKLYHLLFNAITDALDGIDRLELTAAVQRLKDAQIKAEEIILEDMQTIFQNGLEVLQ